MGNIIEEKQADYSLLFRAAKNGAFGKRWIFPNSTITDALFVYLEGTPEPQSICKLNDFNKRPLVCLSLQWREYLVKNYPEVMILERFCMKEKKSFELEKKVNLPSDFTLMPFSKEIFNHHPFEHGKNYATFDDFQKNGSGFVVIHEDKLERKIVSSASSFLSYNGEVELDVSTDSNFRRLGLATACVSAMLEDCQKKGFTVHWDAQNNESKHMAETFGFELDYVYNVYVI